jgi:hypothetical protein
MEQKEKLVEREERVKNQRQQLEEERKLLFDEIKELDNLKNMLETKKKDTMTGFDELA